MDRLVIVTRKFTKEFKIPSTEITIGRSLENTLCLNDETISRCHAKILVRDGRYIIVDMGSYNGTIINGQKIGANSEFPLSHNDQIVIGDYQLVCKFDEPSGEKPEGSLTDEPGLDLDAISGDEELAVPASSAISDDMDLDAITFVEDPPAASLPGQQMPPALDTKQTVRYKTPEGQTTPEEVPLKSVNPFVHASDSEIKNVMDSHSRATRRMPVFEEPKELPRVTEEEDASLEELASLDAKLVADFEGREKIHPLSFPVITLGRGKENDIVLPHFSVSKFHSEIRYEEGEFVLYDLNTTNGTMVNDSMIQRCVLTHEDAINFGQVFALFHCKAFPRQESRRKETFSEEEICQMLVIFKVISKGQAKGAMKESLSVGKSLKQALLTKGLVNPIQWAQAKEALILEGGPGGKSKILLVGLVLALLLSIGVFVWVLSMSSAGSKKDEERLKKAQAALDQGDYEKVLLQIPLKGIKKVTDEELQKKILQVHLKARYELGKAFRKKGLSAKALEEWKKIIELLPPKDDLYSRAAEEIIWEHIEEGRKLGEAGEIGKQLGVYEKGIRFKGEIETLPRSYKQLVSETALTYQKWGEELLLAKKFTQAQEKLERILKLPLSHQESKYKKGRLVLELSRALVVFEDSSATSEQKSLARLKLERFFQANNEHSFFSTTHPLYRWAMRYKEN